MTADFEFLRHVVRRGGGDPGWLALEAAEGLASFAHDPSGLVIACRRLLAHHPDVAPLWWIAARLLEAGDVTAAAAAAARALRDDPTELHVQGIPEECFVRDVVALDPSGATLDVADRRAAEGARRDGRGVVAVAPRGFTLPQALATRLREHAVRPRELALLPLDGIDHVVGPRGRERPEVVAGTPECPVAPELLARR